MQTKKLPRLLCLVRALAHLPLFGSGIDHILLIFKPVHYLFLFLKYHGLQLPDFQAVQILQGWYTFRIQRLQNLVFLLSNLLQAQWLQ